MSTAILYNITYVVIESNDGVKTPIAKPSTINCSMLQHQITSYINSNGIELTNSILEEINDLDPFNTPVDGYEIYGYNEETSCKIYSSPPRTAFWDGNIGENIYIPLQDWIDILNEWIAFLESLNYQHYLSGR